MRFRLIFVDQVVPVPYALKHLWNLNNKVGARQTCACWDIPEVQSQVEIFYQHLLMLILYSRESMELKVKAFAGFRNLAKDSKEVLS